MKKLFSVAILALGTLHAAALGAAEGEAPVAPVSQDFMQTIVMFAVAGLFFYFILYRPEQKRRKEAAERRNNLAKGDRVMASGIVGTVSKIQEQTVILQMVDGSKIEVVKEAINEVLPATQSTT
jgi:preprotein translocase subunit YajC